MAIYLRSDRFRDACHRRGWLTIVEQAQQVGVSRSSLIRIMKREQMPRLNTVAAILDALGERFETLFDVHDETPPGRDGVQRIPAA